MHKNSIIQTPGRGGGSWSLEVNIGQVFFEVKGEHIFKSSQVLSTWGRGSINYFDNIYPHNYFISTTGKGRKTYAYDHLRIGDPHTNTMTKEIRSHVIVI